MPAHIHAESMALYAQDAMETDEPWTRWQMCDSNSSSWWIDTLTHPSWAASLQYRRKPRTIRIGEYDVPEPLRAAPEVGVDYWVVHTASESLAAGYDWKSYPSEVLWLQRGLIHLTREAAELHGRALVALTEVKS